MTIEVLHPGMLTTVQDEGRFGLRGVGVVTSGAMDRFALQAANLLVGNERGAAALEMTLTGATLVFHDDALVALCGADMDARLAAAAPEAPIAPAAWAIAPSARPPYAEQPAVRVTRGREAEAMTGGSLHSFFTTPYSITPQSDRMGYRLAGARLEEAEPREMISEAVTMGTVQVPPGGQPIVLMADAQTTGGYPRIAQVAAADLPLLAQLKPGGTVRFREITLQEAQSLYIRQQLDLRRLEQLVRLKAGTLMP